MNMNELEWYIDYLEFQMMMKHKDNPMVTSTTDTMNLQMFKVLFTKLRSFESRLEMKEGYRVQDNSELTGLLFQKKRHIPIIEIKTEDIERASVR